MQQLSLGYFNSQMDAGTNEVAKNRKLELITFGMTGKSIPE